jgi:hypothetical protein
MFSCDIARPVSRGLVLFAHCDASRRYGFALAGRPLRADQAVPLVLARRAEQSGDI